MLRLFFATLQLSAFTVGGGYVIVPLMQKKFVDKYKWIDSDEMLDIVALSQSAPGAIAINASILVGYRIAGVLGAIVSVLGTVIPPLTFISIISYAYVAFSDNRLVAGFLKGLQGGICAVIVDVVLKMAKPFFKEKSILSIVLMITAFCLAVFTDINVIFIILGGVILGVFLYFLRKNAKKRKSKNPEEIDDFYGEGTEKTDDGEEEEEE